MSDINTHHMLELMKERIEKSMGLAKQFKTTPRSFFNTVDVEYDTVRGDQKIAGIVSSLDSTGNKNQANKFSNTRVEPPTYREEINLNSSDLVYRRPGQDPFQDPSYRANIMEYMMDGMERVSAKIVRAIEWQASQILQTGKMTLQYDDGSSDTELDYSPKSTHFPTAGTSWSSASFAQKLADLESLADAIRKDGLVRPNKLILGASVLNNLLLDSEFQGLYDNRSIDVGVITPGVPDEDALIPHGIMKIGRFRYDLYTYDGFGTTPAGLDIDFLDDGKVIMLSSQSNLQAAFGNVPHIGREMGLPVLLPELPSRISSTAMGIDLHPHVWMSSNGRTLLAEVAARPLMIPKGIDTFGCLTTGL